MKSRRIGIGIGLGALLGGLASPLGATASQPAPATEGSTVSVVAGEINWMGPTAYPSSFADIQVDDASTITVFVTGQDQALIRRVDGMIGGTIHATYVRVRYSAQSLRSLARRVAADDALLRGDGVSIEQLTPNAIHGTIDTYLQTPASTASALASTTSVAYAQSLLNARYGASMLTVEKSTEAAGVDLSCQECRTNDFTPFYGGDSITDPVAGCTSGFGVTDSNGKSGELTAGHCFPSRDTVSINCVSPSQGEYCPVRTLGTVGPTYLPPNTGLDYEVVDDSGAAVYVYGGSVTNSTPPIFNVEGTVTEPGGDCCLTVDGAGTGEISGNRVITAWTCFNSVCSLGEVQNNSNGNLGICRHGDSGGPVYEHDWAHGNAVLAQGLIEQGGRSLDGGTTFTQCYFTELSEVFLASPGVHILFSG